MNYPIRGLIIGLTALVFGCAGTPQTAEEFRGAVSDSMVATIERLEVDRSYNRVANTLEIMTAMCFDRRARETGTAPDGQQEKKARWYATVIVTDAKTEMHLQQEGEPGLMATAHPPENGAYQLVVDAYPTGDDKTFVVLYRPVVGHGELIRTIKGWISGEYHTCPGE